MKSYIKKPAYIENIDSLHSNNLRQINFRKYYEPLNNVYDLDLLRDIYKSNKSLFFDVRDEMLLRGFIIKTDIESSLFPFKSSFNNSKLISVETNKNNYLQIDFESLKLGSFIKRFLVDDDRFFDLIPIENFTYLNQSVNLDLLNHEFAVNSFPVISKDQLKADKNPSESLKEESATLKNYSSITITDYFGGGSFNLFIKFCIQNNIKYVDEINEDVFNKFKNFKGVGTRRLNDVKEKYNSFNGAKKNEEVPNKSPVFNIISLLENQHTIESSFKENKFNQFRVFCKELNIKYLEELFDSHLALFEKSAGIGPKKYNDIISRIGIIKKEIEKDHNFLFNYNLKEFDLHEFSVNEVLNIIKSDMKLQEDLLIEEIYDQDITKLDIEEDDRAKLYHLLTTFRIIENPNKLVQDFIENLDERDQFILTERYKQNATLETIGKQIDTTRERVRQILKKIVYEFILHLDQSLFKESIILSFLSFDYTDFNIISVSEFERFIEKDYLFILNLFIDDDTFFYYEKSYNLFFLEKSEKKQFRSEMNKVAEQLPDIFVLEEVHEAFQTQYFRNGIVTVERFLKENSYRRSGKIYSQRSLILEDVLYFLFLRELPDQVKLTEENYEKIKLIAKEKYHYNLQNPQSSVINVLHSSEKFLLIDGTTYKILDIDDYNVQILQECMNYGESILEDRNQVNIGEIFDEFESVLLENKIYNKTHLYSILKHLYADEFQFGKGNTLNIYNKGINKVSEEDVLISYMEQNNGIRSKSEIKNRFKWSEQKISLKTSVSDKIISWGRNSFKILGDIVRKEHIEETTKIINSFFEKQGFITENQLYDEAQFSMVLYDLINQENIDTADKYRSVFRPSLGLLRGTSILITPKYSRYNSIYDVLMEKYPTGITRDKLYEYLTSDLLYNENTANMIMDNLLSKNIMFEIELGVLYPTNKLNISNNVIENLVSYIEKEREEQPYIILKHLSGYRAKLPKINVEWTPYLMKYLLLSNGYKNLEAFNTDYRTDQLILIEEDHEINKLDELLYNVLNQNYTGNWHEEYVAEYLERKGFIYNKRYKRTKLPISLYKNSKLINVSEVGIVELVDD